MLPKLGLEGLATWLGLMRETGHGFRAPQPTSFGAVHLCMHGVHKRVGEVRKPDGIITIDVLHVVDKVLEAEWRQSKTVSDKQRICKIGAWMMGRLLYRSSRGRDVVGRHVAWGGNKCSEIDGR